LAARNTQGWWLPRSHGREKDCRNANLNTLTYLFTFKNSLTYFWGLGFGKFGILEIRVTLGDPSGIFFCSLSTGPLHGQGHHAGAGSEVQLLRTEVQFAGTELQVSKIEVQFSGIEVQISRQVCASWAQELNFNFQKMLINY